MSPSEKSRFSANLKRWLPSRRTVLFIAWKVALPLLALYIAFLGYINWAMHQPPEEFGRVMMHIPGPAYLIIPFETFWNGARAGTVEPGQVAPEFNLAALEDGHANPAHRVSLAALQAARPGGEPVVLVFGSYT